LTIAAVLVGTPVLAAACELTCKHSSAKSHLSGSQASHHHHGDAASVHTDSVSVVVKTACERDCCRDTGLAATAAINGRGDTNVYATVHSFVTVTATFFQNIQASPTAPIRGAPPGRSPDSARPLPLRI
jgi:hypothetical protein